MKILSWNVNGLRACVSHGGDKVFEQIDPDVICLQEIKLSEASLDSSIAFLKEKYEVISSLASSLGRNGVLIASKIPILSEINQIDDDTFDSQGRFLAVQLANGFRIADLYMPHGKRDKSEIGYKLSVFEKIKYSLCVEEVVDIICTDFNVAHTDQDLARPKENTNNTMFTEDERKLVDQLLEADYCDILRDFYHSNGHYTWWPYGFNAWERNIGWRIDYFFVHNSKKNRIKAAKIMNQIRCSDHCPIVLDILD